MNVGILGLGLIGGSLARAYAKAGHRVGYSEESGLLCHHVCDLLDRHSRLLIDEADDCRVDGTAACAHYESLERRQAHRCVIALAALDGCDG